MRLRELCLIRGSMRGATEVDKLVNRRRPIRRGDYLYRAGNDLQSLYAIRTGFIKSCVLHEDGREQVAGFHMMGELLGLDAISSGRHLCDAIALEDTEVCDIPFGMLERLSREIPALQHLPSREIPRSRVMLLLGSMRGGALRFPVELSQRLARAVTPPPNTTCA
jgi:CRP/FNR family transcriptional regulator